MEGLKIHQYLHESILPIDLLLLADPSLEMIMSYIFDSKLFLVTLNREVIACFALFPHDSILVEIKNLAVRESYQGKGIGSFLLGNALETSIELGYQKIRICTGNSSLGQLHLYQKFGFVKREVIKGFFLNNYPEPIIENGLECVDLIIFEKEL